MSVSPKECECDKVIMSVSVSVLSWFVVGKERLAATTITKNEVEVKG